MNLTHKKDFWQFYKANKSNVDGIVTSIMNGYQIPDPMGEFHAEVLYRLSESNWLSRYNGTTALNTFLTHQVRGEVLHVLTEEKHAKARNKKYFPGGKVYVDNWNGQEEDAVEQSLPECADPEGQTDAECEYNDLKDNIRGFLRAKDRPVYDLMLQGATTREISIVSELSVVSIGAIYRSIRERTLYFLSKSGLEKIVEGRELIRSTHVC